MAHAARAPRHASGARAPAPPRARALSDRPEPADPVVSFFERHAGSYDLQLPLERRALRLAAALAEPLTGAHVVDLAAGTGGLCAAILERRRPLAALTAVDASPRMLRRAATRLRSAAVRPAFIVADARAVPLPDGCADVVGIGYLLHLLGAGPREQVLEEAFRLLRPGGRLIAVVHGSPGGRPGELYRGAWRLLERGGRGGVIGHGPMADVAPDLRAAGFEVDVSRRVPGVYWSQVVRGRRPG